MIMSYLVTLHIMHLCSEIHIGVKIVNIFLQLFGNIGQKEYILDSQAPPHCLKSPHITDFFLQNKKKIIRKLASSNIYSSYI